jgi:NAD+ synthase
MKDFDSQQEINKIVSFLQTIFKKTNKQKAVVAVSGGIDSAVSLSLATKALGAENVFPILLPYKNQDMSDAIMALDLNKIPAENRHEIQISPAVEIIAKGLNIDNEDKFRLGNVMARVRMINIYDLAKKLNALVCGTENKSEKYLGYFTRFGDEASDVEPIIHLYKNQVRVIAKELNLPEVFLSKAPSAGLWSGQTDEKELGFSYEELDKVLVQYIDQKAPADEIKGDKAKEIISKIESMAFKQVVPYKIEDR